MLRHLHEANIFCTRKKRIHHHGSSLGGEIPQITGFTATPRESILCKTTMLYANRDFLQFLQLYDGLFQKLNCTSFA